MWDERYADEEYAYGTEPNQFFKDSLLQYQPEGSILMVAEGEGRNAVYAAEFGLEVSAFDISHDGKKKALKLAKDKDVSIHYEVGNLEELFIKHKIYGTAAMIFAHLPLSVRTAYHEKISEMVQPNGLLILEGFSQNHMTYQERNPNVGGPKKIEMLYTKNSIMKDFTDFEPLYLEEEVVDLEEGKYHNGLAKVIRFVGKNKDIA